MRCTFLTRQSILVLYVVCHTGGEAFKRRLVHANVLKCKSKNLNVYLLPCIPL